VDSLRVYLNGVELREGDSVEYNEEEGRKGMVAANVQVL
jgi:CspA family cold shock protein